MSPKGSPVPHVPRVARGLLSMALHRDDRAFALADLEEEFEGRCHRLGPVLARRWYRAQVVRSLAPALQGRLVRRGAARRSQRGISGEGMMLGGLKNLMSDLRIAARSLRKAPGVLLITVVSLGVGIGAVTSVFGIANTLLFRGPVGISDPERLMVIYTTRDNGDAFGWSSLPDYRDVVENIDGLADAAAADIRMVALERGETVKPLLAEATTSNYFTVTGIRPALGRSFLPEDGEAGGERVALISQRLWQGEFGGRTDVLGTAVRLGGNVHTVVGVVPDGVTSRKVPLEPDVWVPLVEDESDGAPAGLGARNRDTRNVVIIGRLSEGTTSEALGSQLAVLSARLQAEYPAQWEDRKGNLRAFTPLSERRSRVRPGMRMVVAGVATFLLGSAGLLLLIACANVTTLFLARSARRSREMAVRLSLGASRRRIITMLLTEGLIPGLAAGAVGLGVATWINHAMTAAVASIPFGVPINLAFEVDARVVAVAILLSLGASLVFGLLPALEGSRPDLVGALKGDGGGASGRHRLRDLLVAIQCAASMVLIVGAALFVRSLANTSDLDLGLSPDRIAVTTKKLDAEGFGREEGWQYIRDLQAKLGARADVDAVNVSRTMELTLMTVDPTLGVEVEAVGYTPAEGDNQTFTRNSVTPGYLEMLDVPLLRGRTLLETDVDGAPLVAVVNETFARRLWPGQDPIGQTFQASPRVVEGGGRPADKRTFQVVGLARDGKYMDFDDPPMPYFWTSIFQDYASHVVVTVRGTASAEAMIPLLRQNVQLAPGEVQLTPPTTLARQLSYQFTHLRIASKVLRWSGTFGLFLAVIGIYGIVSFAVTQRTREMAIRMAVGAESRQVLYGVIVHGMRPALTGLVVGMAVALAGSFLLASVLVGVRPVDPLAFGGGAAVLVLAAFVASVLPARRALGIDPMATLREE